MISVLVQELIKDKDYDLQLKLISGEEGLSKRILIPQIQKPGLALVGYTSNLHPGRVQVFGIPEMDFIRKMSPSKQKTALSKIGSTKVPCIIVTDHGSIPPLMKKIATTSKIPLLSTSLTSSLFIIRVNQFLEDRLTESTSLHGVLMDIFGVGILLIGKSGIGKSECALELVMKGHRLVSDDIVNIKKKPPNSLYGIGSDLIKYHMEIRGLGIINIKDLFGVASVRDRKLIELAIELVEWNPKKDYERLGIDQQTFEIMEVKIPFIQLPVRPGRSLTSVIEVAARNQLLKLKGYYSAREFQEKLMRELLSGHSS